MKRLALFVDAHTSAPRLEAISRCEQLIDAYGVVEDFKIFYKVAIHFVVEIPTSRLRLLLSHLEQQDFLQIDRVSDPFSLLDKIFEQKDATMNFNLTFFHNEEDEALNLLLKG